MSDQPNHKQPPSAIPDSQADRNDEPARRALAVPSRPFASGRAYLNQLLSERNQHAARAAAIDEQILRAFQQEVAILAMDMCDFTRITMTHGIIHFLAMIRQMEEVSTPAVDGNGGRVIKQEADDLFAVFGEPAQALEAALDILRGFDAINNVLPPERHLHCSIGIGFGEALIIDDADLFGVEMNLASKLGEDLARCGEILLTEAAGAAAKDGDVRLEERTFSVSGVDLRAFQLGG
jgi:class 3 adenylate cyclase